MNKNRLQAECLPSNGICSYVRVTIEGRLVGNTFACRWACKGKIVCWITQLVIHREFRERGLAVGLLSLLRRNDDMYYGIASSHPAACLAAAKAFGGEGSSLLTFQEFTDILTGGIEMADAGFIRDNAEAIIKVSPVAYVRGAKCHGRLFDPEDVSGAVSSVDTGFLVDHEEPFRVLKRVRERRNWPLGELLDGHEFLLIMEACRA